MAAASHLIGDQSSSTTLIAETYHSTIEAWVWKDTKAVIKRCRRRDARSISNWRKEVNILRHIRVHENITQILDFDSQEFTIVLRCEDGRSLDKHVDSQMKSILSPSDCSILLKQMSSALADLHANLIIHDDVKPDNMMWDSDRKQAVLIDFGAALWDTEPVEFNPSGTPPYAPPEFLRRRKGREGDVWALGVTMLFASRHVRLPDGEWILPHTFEDEAVLQEMMAWLAEVEQLRGELIETNDLLAEMLEADPDSRIRASEIVQRLEGSEKVNK